jgi:hypothetical protein
MLACLWRLGVTPDDEAPLAIRMRSQPVHSHCQNCEAKLQGPYCYRCGQHDFDVSRSFHHVFLEALENFFHFDAKFFRNVVTLLCRPGVLSAEYNAGKRVSQMPPFRFYLFISVLFFFLGFLTGRPVIQAAPARPASLQVDAPGTAKTSPAVSAHESSSARPAARVGEQTLQAALREKLNRLPEDQSERVRELGYAFPKILILCLPLFALFTRGLFRSEGQTYLQHLVVAVHFHTFIFLWKMVGDGWTELLGLFSHRLALAASGLVALWFILYPLLMFRRLYRKPWLPTLAKSLLLFVVYSASLVSCFVVTAGLLVFLR